MATTAWATPKIWVAAPNYSMPKLSTLFGDAASGTAVVLHLPEVEQAHPLLALAPTAQQLLLSNSSTAPPTIVVMDLSPLLTVAPGAVFARFSSSDFTTGRMQARAPG